MSIAAERVRRFKRLAASLKRGGGRHKSEPIDDPLEQLMRGILGRAASEARAAAALARLREQSVDLNDLRVTSVADLVETIGVDFPLARTVAENLSRALIAVFNRRHAMDLDHLKNASRKAAEGFLSSIDGVDPHARATVLLHALNFHAVPVDDLMLACLRRSGCVPADADIGTAQSFLERHVKRGDAAAFYSRFKRFAATHAPRGAAARPVPDAVAVESPRPSPRAEKKRAAPAARRKKRPSRPAAKSRRAPKRPRRRSDSKKRRPNRTRAAARRKKSGVPRRRRPAARKR